MQCLRPWLHFDDGLSKCSSAFSTPLLYPMI
jgi:hypothetical protein